METQQIEALVSFLQAAGQRERLHILGILAEGASSVPELARRTDLRGTAVIKHLGRLKRAALVYETAPYTYQLNESALEQINHTVFHRSIYQKVETKMDNVTFQESIEPLLKALESGETAAEQRLQIGKRLAEMGDPRPGVGVKDGLPEFAWLPVAPGGKLKITRHWQPDAPGDEEKFSYIGPFAVEPFYIAKYLVTYAQYQAFAQADDGYDNLTWWQGMPETYQRQQLADQRTKQKNNPRDTISWYQSVAFARWINHRLEGLELPEPTGADKLVVGENAQIRLPTEWEWQWAGQNGVDARRYPWGKAKSGCANTAESGLKQATAVGMYPHGAAACGALDMAGNLMEWCANDKSNPAIIDVASTASKVLRGGDWGYNLENAATTYCDDDAPGGLDALNGFRLVLGRIVVSE